MQNREFLSIFAVSAKMSGTHNKIFRYLTKHSLMSIFVSRNDGKI